MHPSLVEDFLYEVHDGMCGMHSGGRSLAHRAITQGYWWPYMQADAEAYVRKCEKCQKFSPLIHLPARDLTPLTSPWPFAQWGLDIVGPIPRASGNRKFLITATDYFTKWIEAEPLVKITETEVKKFVWRNVITRFGIPRALISDNGKQFDGKKFRQFCSELKIDFYNSTPAYPQSNGQAEASNKTVLNGIKRRLERAKGKWTEELSNVLWAYRTTPRRPTGETPFALAYGLEAVIPLEVGLPTIRSEVFEELNNNQVIMRDLDLAEERREATLVRIAAYQQQLSKSYNKKVHPRKFDVGDLVLRQVTGNTQVPGEGKLGPNWEGPYKVTSMAGVGAYRLEDLEGNAIPRAWNGNNLKKFYH